MITTSATSVVKEKKKRVRKKKEPPPPVPAPPPPPLLSVVKPVQTTDFKIIPENKNIKVYFMLLVLCYLLSSRPDTDHSENLA